MSLTSGNRRSCEACYGALVWKGFGWRAFRASVLKLVPMYCAVVAESTGTNARAALASWDKDHDHVLARTHRKVDSIIKKSRQYELQDNLLYRRVFDVSDREVQLRLVAPTGSLAQQEVIGVGQKPLAFLVMPS